MTNPKSSQHEALKPLVYELGVTIYLCQQFEASLLFLIATLNAHQDVVTVDSFKTGIRSYSKQTLGQLAKVFKLKLQLPEAYEDYIHTGVETRNNIVHGFIMRNTERLLSADGRAQVINELQRAQHTINDRIESINTILDRALSVFGGSLEQLRKDVEFRFKSTGDVTSIFH